MLKKLAVALVAASVFAAPVLAKTAVRRPPSPNRPSPRPPRSRPPSSPSKHVKKSRHTGKQVRNFRHGKVANFSAKGRTAIRSTGHVRERAAARRPQGEQHQRGSLIVGPVRTSPFDRIVREAGGRAGLPSFYSTIACHITGMRS